MKIMNKIVIVNNEIVESQIDNSVKINCNKASISEIGSFQIGIFKNTDLVIECDCKEMSKLELYVNVSDDVTCNIYEYKHGNGGKFGYKYYIEKNADVNVYKFNDVSDIKEQVIFNLNGDKASLNYILKTISKDNEKYDLLVYHNSSNTFSNVINNGVNIKKGEVKFNVSGFIPKGKKACELNQNGRIINLTNNTCQINPNLFIDEYDCVANHSAYIGKCNRDEMFYLMSRGITYKKAETLLIKGFLLRNMNVLAKIMEKSINKYWR